MKVLVIGAAGQLGTDLMSVCPDAVPLTHAEIDICDAVKMREVLDQIQPDVVVNTAAYNLVDRAEDEPVQAFQVNAVGVENLARWCGERQAKLVHVSTDYVFGGDASRSIPYTESDDPAPVNRYGQSKLAGERVVATFSPRHLIVRTCGLYGMAATRTKGNFVKTMLRLAEERDELRVVDDQHCTPSWTFDVAAAIASLIEKDCQGIFHVTNSGAATWYAVARKALELVGSKTKVVPITSAEYPTRAKRPGYSVLDCSLFEQSTGEQLPHWEQALERYLAEFCP